MKLRFFELSSLVRWEHSKGCANFHAHSADLTNHLKNSFKSSFSTSKISPSSTHTETCASVFLCFPSSLQNRFKLNKPWSCRWSRIFWRLRAVRTYDPIDLRLIHLEEEDWFTTNNLRCILQLQKKQTYIRIIKDINLRNGLLMFMRVHSWILLGLWCCLCTEADRKTRSSNGVSYISWISSFSQLWRVIGLLGVTRVASDRLKEICRLEKDRNIVWCQC